MEKKGGVISVCALFANSDGTWRPGQLVKVQPVRQATDDVLIPSEAATTSDHVWVVKADASVERRQIKLGERVGSLQIVTSGLLAGDRVVVEGAENCREGGKVLAQPYIPKGTP